MPAFSLPGLEAFTRAGKNPHYRWASVTTEAGEHGVGGRCFRPALFPKFHITRNEPAFAIGSCFAQEVQLALLKQDFHFVSIINEAPVEEFFMQQVGDSDYRFWPLHFFHRYNVPSMLQEIKRLTNPASPLNGEALLFKDDKGRVCDYHYHSHFPLASVDLARERRGFIRDRLLGLRDCKFIIVTLGLTEVWFDRETGLYLNITPTYRMVSEDPDRFIFMVLNAAEIREGLEELISEIRGHAPGIKTVITVSPIPLEGTFSPNDIVVSTNYSKAALIAAAREVAYENEDIDYFPSYEIVASSVRSGVWTEDQRHVKPDFVELIMQHFADAYVK